MEECPPDEVVAKVEITGTLDELTGIWTVNCKQWHCTVADKSLTRAVAMISAEIENHNECEPLVPAYSTHKPLRNRPQPMPDDGKRTPGNWWQRAA